MPTYVVMQKLIDYHSSHLYKAENFSIQFYLISLVSVATGYRAVRPRFIRYILSIHK
jgi:hypothetical protein